MSESVALVPTSGAQVALTHDDHDTLKRTIAKDLNDRELDLFAKVCGRMGLDPFARQICAVKRGGDVSFQVTIDGFRLIADRTGKYEGQTPPEWCGSDGKWVEVWLDEKKPPVACRVGVYRTGFKAPVYAVAKVEAYRQNSPWWKKAPDHMVVKCCESLALRKAFPAELSGVYTPEEMGQSEADDAIAVDVEAVRVEAEPVTEAQTGTRDEWAQLGRRAAEIANAIGKEEATRIRNGRPMKTIGERRAVVADLEAFLAAQNLADREEAIDDATTPEELEALAARAGWTADELADVSREKFGTTVDDLDDNQRADLIASISRAIEKVEAGR